jgi:hypothetical protein
VRRIAEVPAVLDRFRSPEERCQRSLVHSPVPMISEPLDLAVLWNAKAGCTFAIKWLYFQEGILEEALEYASWPHQYRQQVYCKRPHYADGLKRIPSLGPRAIKFVRNPYDRAVGAYLSYSQQAYRLSSPQHVPVLKAIGSHLRREVGDGQLFTFREFVGFLGTLDLDTANIHVRRQISRCEQLDQLPELTLVRIEESDALLPRIEERLGLQPSDLAGLRRSRHHSKREDFEGF